MSVSPPSCRSASTKRASTSLWRPPAVYREETALTEFSRPRSAGIIAVNLNEGDELIGVDLTSGQDEVMLFSAAGKVVRFKKTPFAPWAVPPPAYAASSWRKTTASSR